MKLRDLSDDDLRSLINRQLHGKRKAEQDASELTVLLTESLGEFHQRVNGRIAAAQEQHDHAR